MHSANDSEKQTKPTISPWDSSSTLREAFQKNGVRITKLDTAALPEVKLLMENNKDDSGFKEMSAQTLNGTTFEKIIRGESPDHCLVAKQIFTNKIIGFVIFGNSAMENCGAIDSIGVDRNLRSSAETHSANQPRQVGISLLLAACNELYRSNNITQIGVMISNDDAAMFYHKFAFEADSDDPDELYQNVEDYHVMENYLAANLKSKSTPSYSLNKVSATTEVSPVSENNAVDPPTTSFKNPP